MERTLSEALDDLILGRGVARGRHELLFQGRPVRAEFVERLEANAFTPTRVSAVDIVAGEKVPAFHLDADGTAADFGWIRIGACVASRTVRDPVMWSRWACV